MAAPSAAAPAEQFAGGGMAINNAGRIQVKRNDGVDASLVFLVKDSSDNDSISMRGNGSSSFAGTVDIGNRDTGSASGSGHRLFTNSTYSALRTQVSSSATDQTIVYQVDRGTDTNKIQFTAGGSATFAGRIESKGSGSSSVFVTRDVTTGDEKGVYLFRGSRNINGGATENVFFINQDGSGSFAGGSCTVASSGRINIDRAEGQQYCFTTGYDGNTEQAHISGNGAIYSSYGLAVGGPGTTQGAGNAVINADGSAEFAGGEVTIFSSGSLRTNGQIYVSDKTTLSSDGSATFNGGNLALQEIGDKSVISLRKDGDNLVHFGATDTQGVLGIDYRSASFQNGTEVIKLNGDTGSAAFAGDVTTSVSGLTGPGFLEMRKEGNIRQRYDGSPDNKYAHALYSLGTNKDELNYILRSDGNIEIGGNLDVSRELSNPNISLRATDGSATFAGGVQFKLAGDGAGTTDSLLLDDYEEGRFTPTFGSDNAGFTATYADGGQVGRYTKIGNIVHCEVYIRLLSTNKLGTGLTINGLPYLSINSSNYGGGPVSVRAGFGSRWPNSGARLNPGANQVILEYDDGSQTTSQVRPQDLTDSSRINFCITYTAP